MYGPRGTTVFYLNRLYSLLFNYNEIVEATLLLIFVIIVMSGELNGFSINLI